MSLIINNFFRSVIIFYNVRDERSHCVHGNKTNKNKCSSSFFNRNFDSVSMLFFIYGNTITFQKYNLVQVYNILRNTILR